MMVSDIAVAQINMLSQGKLATASGYLSECFDTLGKWATANFDPLFYVTIQLLHIVTY